MAVKQSGAIQAASSHSVRRTDSRLPCVRYSAFLTRPGLVPFASALVGGRVGAGLDGGHRQGPDGRRLARRSAFPTSPGFRRCWTAGSRHCTRRCTPASSRAGTGRTTSRRSRPTTSRRSTWSSSTSTRSPQAAARTGHAVRRTWSRRSTSAGRACCARPPRTSATCWSWSNPPTTTGCSMRLVSPQGPSAALRFDLARRAFAHTAAYDQMIATTLGDVRVDEVSGEFLATACEAAERASGDLAAAPDQDQGPALRREPAPDGAPGTLGRGLPDFGAARTVHQGKELSFTNLLDLDAAARIVLEFDEPAAAVIKHTNPCGVATGADDRRRLRARARGRPAVGVWRHRRPEPAHRRRDGEVR